MEVLEEESAYWKKKQAAAKAEENYWLMKKELEIKLLQAQLKQILGPNEET